MPKAAKTKYYAVKLGREGPQIYNTWDECKANVSRWPGAVHKSFPSQKQAEEWLQISLLVPGSSLREEIHHQASSSSNFILPNDDSPMSEDLEAFFAQSDSYAIPNPPIERDEHDELPSVILSPEQEMVLESVREGKNVFFTGSAGTGKSVLLREIISILGGGPSDTLGITASTGIAAVNIGGTTLHSWAGIGLGQEDAQKLAGKILGQKLLHQVRARWWAVKSLIIDEVSMIDGSLFDKLEHIARIMKRNDKPFGGIQLILSGDFCQLPPVPDRRDGVQIPSTFAFDAEKWSQCVGAPVTLSKVFRQKDQAFVDMLNSMRFGQLDAKTVEEFKKLSRPVKYDDGIGPTELYPMRNQVDTANATQLQRLPGHADTYNALDFAGVDSKGVRVTDQARDRLLERLVTPSSIKLKVGAQVMITKNLPNDRLVNGSVGRVVRFGIAREELKNHTKIAGVDITAKGPGLAPKHQDRRWPVVSFTNGVETLITPLMFTVDNALGGVEASREQVPLILAWALSIHKSQGQTLERVKVDLARIFEKGQAYVALSRATNMKTLEVLNFEPWKVEAHPRVLEWHEQHEQELAMQDYARNNIIDEMDNDEAMISYYDL